MFLLEPHMLMHEFKREGYVEYFFLKDEIILHYSFIFFHILQIKFSHTNLLFFKFIADYLHQNNSSSRVSNDIIITNFMFMWVKMTYEYVRKSREIFHLNVYMFIRVNKYKQQSSLVYIYHIYIAGYRCRIKLLQRLI